MDLNEIKEMFKIVEYLTANDKEEWVNLLHRIIVYIEEAEEAVEAIDFISSDSETELDEFGTVAEGVPEVKIDEQGFHSLA
tara:strand:- start:890 stop:1132 length:243 start_codon:yes stop_codon:yes gene_type:complete